LEVWFSSFSWKAQEGGEQQRYRSQEICPNTQRPATVSAVTQRMPTTLPRKGALTSFPNLMAEVLSRFVWQRRQPAARGRLTCAPASSTDPTVGF